MVAGEKEGKNPGREGEAESWERRRWQKRGGGERRKKQATFRSGRGPGDHVPFSRAAGLEWLVPARDTAACDGIGQKSHAKTVLFLFRLVGSQADRTFPFWEGAMGTGFWRTGDA
jgi:hypothetical protein